MRYYYTDPIAAAWMAKHFGMKFDILPTQLAYPSEYDEHQIKRMNTISGIAEIPYDWEDPINYISIVTIRDIDSSFLRTEWRKRLYYVHPDSLHLLVPQEKDEGTSVIGDQCIFINGKWCVDNPDIEGNYYYSGEPDEGRIDRRNGVSFMWPEMEE